jgi:hypothetical protein
VTNGVYWVESFAAQRGMRYEAQGDERWLRAWEPYTTLKVPLCYEHVLEATGSGGSITIARAMFDYAAPAPGMPPSRVGTWIAIVQDTRIEVKVATTSDFGGIFSEPLELVDMSRLGTGDPAFDHVFATFGRSADEVARGMTPSVRKLLLSWRSPVHAELRPGGFVLAPVSAPADPNGLNWLLDAVHIFGDKATKRA